MSMNDYATLLPDLEALSIAAGERILEVYRTDFTVTRKQDHSPLTKADMAAHDAIVAGLARITPDIPVLSEESARVPFATRAGWGVYWLVDPLDGTREFIKRNDEFTVNIALIEEGRPVLGVVHAPVSGACYIGARGAGCVKRERAGGRREIRVRALPAGAVIVAASRSHRGDSLNAFLQRLERQRSYEVLGMGSSLKSCLVAEGRADIYPRFGPTSEWDTAAAQAVVEAAGGALVSLDMRPLRYNTGASLLNPSFMAIADMSFDWAGLLAARPGAGA